MNFILDDTSHDMNEHEWTRMNMNDKSDMAKTKLALNDSRRHSSRGTYLFNVDRTWTGITWKFPSFSVQINYKMFVIFSFCSCLETLESDVCWVNCMLFKAVQYSSEIFSIIISDILSWTDYRYQLSIFWKPPITFRYGNNLPIIFSNLTMSYVCQAHQWS
jgi:hypothetical protein